MNRCLVWLIAAGATLSVFSRDPDELDTTILFKKAIEDIKSADATTAKADGKLKEAVKALSELQARFPSFQPKLVAARLAECQRRLGGGETKPEDGDAALTAPSSVVVAKRYADLLAENQRLRRALHAAKADAKEPSTDFSPDLLRALNTVSKQEAEIKRIRDDAADEKARAAAALDQRRKELDDLSKRNLELMAANAGLQKEVKKLQEDFDALKKMKFRKLDELKALKREFADHKKKTAEIEARNAILKKAAVAAKAGDAEGLKKAALKAVEDNLKLTAALRQERAKSKKLAEEKVQQRQQLDIMQLGNAKLRKELKLLKMGVEEVIIQELEKRVDALDDELRGARKAIEDMRVATVARERLRDASEQRPGAEPSKDVQALLQARQKAIDALTAAMADLKRENRDLKDALTQKGTSMTTSAVEDTVTLTDAQRQELQILRQQAAAALGLGDLKAARKHCGKALSLSPTDPDSNATMVGVWLKSNQPAMARPHLAVALEAGVGPVTLIPFLEPAPTAGRKGVDWLALAFDLVAKKPENPAFNRFLGTCLLDNGALSLGESRLRHAWNLGKTFETAKALHDFYQSRGDGYDKQEKLWYDRALKIAPDRKQELKTSETKGTNK